MDRLDRMIKRQENGGVDYNNAARVARHFKGAIRTNEKGLSALQQESLEAIAVRMAEIVSGGNFDIGNWQEIAKFATLCAKDIEAKNFDTGSHSV